MCVECGDVGCIVCGWLLASGRMLAGDLAHAHILPHRPAYRWGS
jgi:hypothetical protein